MTSQYFLSLDQLRKIRELEKDSGFTSAQLHSYWVELFQKLARTTRYDVIEFSSNLAVQLEIIDHRS